jgi:hypothetical protein
MPFDTHRAPSNVGSPLYDDPKSSLNRIALIGGIKTCPLMIVGAKVEPVWADVSGFQFIEQERSELFQRTDLGEWLLLLDLRRA